MKIHFSNDTVNMQNIQAVNNTVHSRTENSNSSAEEEKLQVSTPNYDKVELNSQKTSESDEAFAAKAAKKVMNEIQGEASEERVQKLKEEVSSGTYHVDASYVASKILGYSV